jgi:hypothetical protein
MLEMQLRGLTLKARESRGVWRADLACSLPSTLTSTSPPYRSIL